MSPTCVPRRTWTWDIAASLRPPSGHVFRVERTRGPAWYAKYRLPDGRQVQKKLRPAWTDCVRGSVEHDVRRKQGKRAAVTNCDRPAFLVKVRFHRSASDAQLLAGTSTDPDAFTVFYERYEAAVLGYFVRRTRDPELAADLTAEVFAAVFQAAGRYRPLTESAAGWLFTIANNTLRASVRRGRVEEAARRQIGMFEAVELHDDHLARVQRELIDDEWVSELLARLPKDQREAVRARVLDGMPYEEIASRLQTSSLVVRKRVSRGLVKLRTELEKQP